MPKIHFTHSPKESLDYTLSLPERKDDTDTLVVYVHGFASHQNGEKVVYFRRRFNERGTAFLAFDHRGHGNSSGTMKEMTVTQNLEDLHEILHTVGRPFNKLVLIGSSMGGQTAAWYARTHPERISANLLIAPAFRFLENRKRDLGAEGLEKLQREGELVVKNQWAEVTIGKGIIEDAQKYPMETLLEGYQTPTLILHGVEDDSVPVQDSIEFTQKAKSRPLELLMIAGGDHRLTEHKETLFNHMHLFLSKI